MSIKIENIQTMGWEGALRGMRNPLNSWDKADSAYASDIERTDTNIAAYGTKLSRYDFVIGQSDLALALKLIKAGSEHRKFMRQIMVSVDVTAPLYFYKEFSTYKVGIVANSTSTMHKLASTPITMDCFENGEMIYSFTIAELEMNRLKYLETKDKNEWKKLIVNLPESWLQTRTVTMNYENILSMIHQRKNHKLTEWSVDFITWAKNLPYAKELLFME